MPGRQTQVIVHMLKTAGSVGVHTAELRRAYIGNPSQRINELRDAGYDIESARERSPFGPSRGTRYFLRAEPAPAPKLAAAPAPPPAPPVSDGDTLFELPSTSRSPYEDAA